MRREIAIGFLVASALFACGEAAHEDERARDAAVPDAAIEHAEEAEARGVVVIDPEMLRDLRVTTADAESRAGGEGVTVRGEVQVDEQTYREVGSAVLAGVADVLGAPGQRVEAGAPLALLESVEVGQARADFFSARARAALARQALARKRELVDERIVAKRELQEAEAEDAAARAAERAARAGLAALGVAPADVERSTPDARFTLRAPIGGVVLERTAMRGQRAEPHEPLFRIADLAKLWLTVHAFERDAVRVRPGAAARVAFSALPGRTATGTVTLVGSQVETTSRTIPIRIEIENPDGTLRPGMSATAWLPLGDAGATIVAVPAAALQRTREDWAVFVPRGPGRFELRRVGRGRDLGGEIEITSGLAAGETVVVDGAFLLKAEAEKARGEGAHHDH
jgi:cobalt-zinc-cadmium efflux system membrane fusion protein